MTRNRWLKAHIMIGTRTNVVTAVEVTESNVNDAPVLPALLDTSAKRFDMKRISADKGYLSDANVMEIDLRGAEPFIPPKSNTQFGIYTRRRLSIAPYVETARPMVSSKRALVPAIHPTIFTIPRPSPLA